MKAKRGIYNSATEGIINETWICSTRQSLRKLENKKKKAKNKKKYFLNINEGKTI